ncbi:nucleotide pyrophosphohydrolase [Chloroflexi bacterium TSY]|nr:nucleotide pyrophosphohydrolase [Chloroflexi bacterium TSY]
MDDKTTIDELKEAVADFVDSRNWESFHTPKHLVMSIAIEAAEIMEHFQWLTVDESKEYVANETQRKEVADELADVLIYCLSFADVADIDISTAIRTKLARNEVRFPVPADSG